jgi:hypothetical protein
MGRPMSSRRAAALATCGHRRTVHDFAFSADQIRSNEATAAQAGGTGQGARQATTRERHEVQDGYVCVCVG